MGAALLQDDDDEDVVGDVGGAVGGDEEGRARCAVVGVALVVVVRVLAGERV